MRQQVFAGPRQRDGAVRPTEHAGVDAVAEPGNPGGAVRVVQTDLIRVDVISVPGRIAADAVEELEQVDGVVFDRPRVRGEAEDRRDIAVPARA
jgi:hypothetical protein